MTLIELEVQDLSPSQQAMYRKCIERGESQRMALMFASRQSTIMGGSDRTFNEHQRREMTNMHEPTRQAMLQIARRAGINPAGKYYVGVGRYDDPAAWVSTTDDVKTALKKKNLNAEGLVTHQAVQKPPPPPIALADDIKQRLVRDRLAEVTLTRGKAATQTECKRRYHEAAEYVVAQHGNRKVKAQG